MQRLVDPLLDELLEQIGRRGRPVLERVADGEELNVPQECPDLRGYVELRLRADSPIPRCGWLGERRSGWLESYVEDLLGHDIEQFAERFHAAVVLHPGPHVYPLAERVLAAPIATLWG